MRNTLKVIFISLFVVHNARADVTELIPPGEHQVDVMILVAPSRANELARLLQSAANKDPKWWMEHVKKATPGKALPYDKRMGMSEEEYSEFLSLANKLTVKKSAEAVLTISKKQDAVFALDGGEHLADLSGIEIDLAGNKVRTSFGTTDQGSELNAGENSALGPWSGTMWKLEDVDTKTKSGVILRFSVGKLKESARGLIYYSLRKLDNAEVTEKSKIVFYDLPNAS